MARQVPALAARLLAGVKAEQEAQAQALTRLYQRTSIKRLIKDGLVLADLRWGRGTCHGQCMALCDFMQDE